MRRSLLWAAGGLALVVLAAAVWILLAGAETTLGRHESRVGEEIDALRAHLKEKRDRQRESELHSRVLASIRSLPPVEEFAWLRKLTYPNPDVVRETLTGVHDSGYFYPYEHGWRKAICGTNPQWKEAPPWTPERLLVAMNVHQEFSRGLGTWGTSARQSGEMELLGLWGDLLARGGFSRVELTHMAEGLDLLRSARPAVLDEVDAELAIFARFLILLIREPTAREPEDRVADPSWKSLYSHKFRVVQLLNEAEEQRRLFREVEDRPVWERADYCATILRDLPPRSQNLKGYWNDLYPREASAQMYWVLARTATAIATFRTERGTFPEALDALVPRYLPAVPVCPKTGRPLLYKPGEVSSSHVDPKLRIAWLVR